MLLSTDVNECVQGTHDCEGTCTNTAGGFECGCPQGYQLSSDGRSCIDIDECANDRGGCGQVCSNTPGTFSCGCSEGYKLQPDGFACLRTSYIEKATLAMSRVLIFQLFVSTQLSTSVRRTHTTVQGSVGTPGALSSVTAVLDLTWLQTVETASVRRHTHSHTKALMLTR